MQNAIVVYDPPQCSTRSAHSHSFAEFVRRGGRVNPLALGTDATGADEESETAGLISGRTKRKYTPTGSCTYVQFSTDTHRLAMMMACAMCCAVALFAVVIIGIALGVMQMSDNMASVEAAIRPHAALMMNTTLEAMSDMGGSLHNMHEISEYTNELAAAAGGATGAASTTINSTAIITKRLAAFLAHPTLKLSLGDSLDA